MKHMHIGSCLGSIQDEQKSCGLYNIQKVIPKGIDMHPEGSL